MPLLRLPGLMGRRTDRLTATWTAYGAALGAASVPIALLARPDPRLQIPEHMSAAPTFYLALAGAIAGILFTWPIVRRLSDIVGENRGWPIWLILAAGYALVVPFVTGMIMPFSVVFLNLHWGVIGFLEVPSQILNSTFRMPIEAFVYGTLSIYTGMIAGILFGVGGYAMDELSHSEKVAVHKYAPWAIALTVGLGIIAFAVLGPAETVAKFG